MASTSVRNWNTAKVPRNSGSAAPSDSFRSLIPLILLIYATLIPQEVRFTIAEQTLYPTRIVCILLLPWIISSVANGRYRYHPIDLLFFLGVGWMIISFIAYYDFATGFLRGLPLAIDVAIPYLTARLCLTDTRSFRRVLVAIAPGFLVVGLLIMFESITHIPTVKPLAASIFGPALQYENGQAVGAAANYFDRPRLGMVRGTGPFSHPILAGIYMSTLLAVYYGSGLRGWPFYAGIVAGVCGIFSLSSGAILALLIVVGLTAYDRIQKLISFINWGQFVLLGTVIALFLQFASQNGLISILIRYTLSPATGYYRQLIWQFGSISVATHPWIGIGFTDFDRPLFMGSSVDAHWLMLAIRHGLLTPAAILLTFIAAIVLLVRRTQFCSDIDRDFFVGISIALVVMIVGGMTVAFFGGILGWIFVLLGAAVSIMPDTRLNGRWIETTQS